MVDPALFLCACFGNSVSDITESARTTGCTPADLRERVALDRVRASPRRRLAQRRTRCGVSSHCAAVANDPRSRIDLTGDNRRTSIPPEIAFRPDKLSGVLDQPRSEMWTEVTFARMGSLKWMYLWFTCV